MVLDDKVVVITGGAQGLGLATAIQLAPKKAHIALIDMNRYQLAEAKDVIESAGTAVPLGYATFLTKGGDEVFTEIAKENGRLDAVVNNAGITQDALLLKVKDGAVEKRMTLND